MVATLKSYNHPSHQASPGMGYDGVVRVSNGEAYGSGVLLYGGRAVLTAAHLVDGVVAGDITVYFETLSGAQKIAASRIKVYPGYDTVNKDGDLALVWLEKTAPVSAERYELYRNMDEIGKPFTMVGYGVPGRGTTGIDRDYKGDPMRLTAENRFDTDAATLRDSLGGYFAWNPSDDAQLVQDFDNGEVRYDALGYLLDRHDTGTESEGHPTPGDSGGPAFIDGKVAGIASYTGIFTDQDYDGVPLNSSIGELGFWQRTGYYQQWIDQSLRERYPDPPENREEVALTVTEGDNDTALVWFLLEFTGERTDPDEWLSVDYSTRDGTAVGGEDYLSVNGTLVLYPGEDQAVIPVEIVGDFTPEEDEFFFLAVFNPVGGSFGGDIEELVAQRTIIDNDGLLLA